MVDFICPCCRSNEDVERIDWDCDGISLIYTMYCPHCDVEWREYFKVEYDGYTYQNKKFDADDREVAIN